MERALQPQYEGPFTITEKISDITFKLDMPERYHAIHSVFHASKLAIYNEPTIPGQKVDPPLPVEIKGQEEYEVEKILQHRIHGKSTQYLVWWKGYGPGDDSWLPKRNLSHAKKLITVY